MDFSRGCRDVSDLKFLSDFCPAVPLPNSPNVCWKTGFRPTHRSDSPGAISPLRAPLPRRLQSENLLVLGSVSLHGFWPTDISGKPPRYGNLPALAPRSTLSLGLSRRGFPQCPGRRQPRARLAHLPIWPNCSSDARVVSTPTDPSGRNSTKRFTRWIPPPLICA